MRLTWKLLARELALTRASLMLLRWVTLLARSTPSRPSIVPLKPTVGAQSNEHKHCTLIAKKSPSSLFRLRRRAHSQASDCLSATYFFFSKLHHRDLEVGWIRDAVTVEVAVVLKRPVIVKLKNMNVGARSSELPRTNSNTLYFGTSASKIAQMFCAH